MDLQTALNEGIQRIRDDSTRRYPSPCESCDIKGSGCLRCPVLPPRQLEMIKYMASQLTEDQKRDILQSLGQGVKDQTRKPPTS